jgi:RNA polymerase sigma-70 factor, ECF subfamily
MDADDASGLCCCAEGDDRRMSDASAASDEDLVRRVRAGDEAAARLLFERHLPALRAKARARLPSSLRGKVAESDVIQDAWLAAFLDVGKFEDRGDKSFEKWLQKILRHKLLDEVRRHAGVGKRDARREERLGTDAPVADTGQPSPSADFASVERSAALSAAIDDLPSDQAAVLRWVHQEGLTLTEAGARMGRSADAARKLSGRALVRLGGRLGGGESTTS